MSGKGSKRRRQNTALVEANWPFPERYRETSPEADAKPLEYDAQGSIIAPWTTEESTPSS